MIYFDYADANPKVMWEEQSYGASGKTRIELGLIDCLAELTESALMTRNKAK